MRVPPTNPAPPVNSYNDDKYTDEEIPAGQTWVTAAKVSGKYWYHRKQQSPAANTADPRFQDQLVAVLAQVTGVSLP